MLVLLLVLGGLAILIVLYLNKLYTNTFKMFQSVHTNKFINIPEIKNPIALDSIRGTIPTWLNGIMYRIGPGVFQIERKDGSVFSIQHGLDGLPFVHRFEISGKAQTVKYHSRLTAKALESVIKEKNSMSLMFFGHFQDISFSKWIYNFILRLDEFGLKPLLFKRMKPEHQLIGVTVTPNFPLPKGHNGIGQGRHNLVAKTDTNFLQKINPVSLAPEKVFSYDDYDKSLDEPLSCAHPQFDPETGEVINFTLRIAPLPAYKVFTVSSKGETTVLATITHRKDGKGSRIRAAYIHSFWMTKNFIIIPESPLFYSGIGMNNLLHGTAIASLKWEGNDPTYFHIISRNPHTANGNGLIASIPCSNFFQFHAANAFESVDARGHTILNLDCSSFPNGDIIFKLHDFGIPRENCTSSTKPDGGYRHGIKMPPPKQTSFGDLCRYKVDLHLLKSTEKVVFGHNFDFPRFNQDYLFREYKYLYGCQMLLSCEKTGKESTSIVKIDLETGSFSTCYEEGVMYSEPIFVQNPEGTLEDDGVLITLANEKKCCYLVILDAINLKELSRFKVGAFNATTFHGSYIDHEFKQENISSDLPEKLGPIN